MSPRSRHRVIPTPALIISYLAAQSRAAFVNDFSAYPVNSRSCMDTAAAASGCTGNTVTEMNTCLCGNGGDFVLATARCVEKQAKGELGAVYAMLLTSCTDSRTPLGISQAQFLDPDDDEDNVLTTFATSITKAPTAASSIQATTTSTSLTTYQSVAPGGVTVTITRGIDVVPTGTDSGKQDSDDENSDSSNDNDSGRPALAAGIAGGLALVIAALAFLCYRRRKQRKERNGRAGPGGKFAALSSATSLTTMTASSPRGHPPTTAYNGANGLRPDTAHSVQMRAGTAAWGHQQQQHGPESPQHWQNNSSNQYGQHTGNWPSPVTNTDGTIGTWGVSPVSPYPTHSTRGPESPPVQNASWNAHAAPAGVPAPHPSYPSSNTYNPVFELPGDETQAVEADSTPIGHAQPVQPPSRSIQSTPAHMSAQPTLPAPTHPSMPRQIDDALQISQVELPPPRYSGPSSGSEWVSEDKKLG